MGVRQTVALVTTIVDCRHDWCPHIRLRCWRNSINEGGSFGAMLTVIVTVEHERHGHTL